MAEERASAVFPHVAPKRGHYESFYLRACHPSEELGVWIRHTVHKRPGQAPRGSVWFTLWDPEPHASKVTVDDLSVPADGWIRVGDSSFSPGRAAGSARTDQCDASWDLSFEPEAAPLRHLPAGWMYSAPVPRTKTESPAPAAYFRGEVTVDGRTVTVDGWPGAVGHNWGAEHAERWIWLHGIGFDGAERDWIDAAIGRIKLGPVTTPWIGNGAIFADGRLHRLGGPAALRSTEVDESPERCVFTLPGKGVVVRGEVGAGRSRLVAWVYADPGGGEHHTVNCSVASMRLRVEREGEPPLELHTASNAVYELGMRETDHGVPVQPFPDG
jgi:hypothetical protein